MTYAEGTSVSVEKSRAEIETTLRRYGATEFAYATNPDAALVGFKVKNRVVRFHLPLPHVGDKAFTEKKSYGGKIRQLDDQERRKLYEAACRQRWRALALVIKAKLEAVECGITTFEEEFLAHIVIPGGKGQTVGQWIRPQLEHAHETGKMPPLLSFEEAK